MAIPLPPPPSGDEPRPAKPVKPAATPPRERSTYGQLGGFYVYVPKIKLRNDTLAAWLFLLHEDKWELEPLEKALEACARKVAEVMVATRRRQLAESRTPIEHPHQANEDYFDVDVRQLEHLMCKDYGFKLLRPVHSPGTELEPTIAVGLPPA